ncbi:MAG: DUF424 family protein [Euryarchaeota archaeon]|nr:DUF424 family protein [Euryarchaeota archaeon]
MIAAKEYRQGEEILFAACDVDCLDKHLKEGKVSLKVDPDFYDGGRIDDAEFALAFRRATIANLVGDKVVGLAIDLGFIESGQVITIDGVPHAQYALLM